LVVKVNCKTPADCKGNDDCVAGKCHPSAHQSEQQDQQIEQGSGRANAQQPTQPTTSHQAVIGESALTVEQSAKAQGCVLNGAAKLLSSEYSEELYKVSCTNSDSLIFRCIYRNCERLR
jgi:hypothetical protein